MVDDIRSQLFESVDEDYRLFQEKLIPNCENILGVRVPKLRVLAKTIAKQDWCLFLEKGSEQYYEEILLKGMVIGYAKMDVEEKMQYIESFVPKIDNWAVCDSFCSGLKFTTKHRERVWDFIMPYFQSKKEFEVRFAVVMLLNYFVEEKFIEIVLRLFNDIKHDGYYVNMAVAWAVSICFIKFPEKTMKFLQENELDDITYNKALQKITESFRVDQETKTVIRQMKRKITKSPLE